MGDGQPKRKDATARAAAGHIWRARRGSRMAAPRLAGMRLRRGWGMLLAIALGSLVAVVLLCAVPLYATLIGDVEIQRIIHDGGPDVRAIQISARSPSISATSYDDAHALVDGLARQYLGPVAAGAPSVFATSDELPLVALNGQPPAVAATAKPPQTRFTFFDFASAAPRMRLVAGVLPSDTASEAEAVITQEVAQRLSLRVGDRVTVGFTSRRATVRVVGIWAPVNAGDAYWQGASYATADPPTPRAGPTVYPIEMSRGAFFAALSQFGCCGLEFRVALPVAPEHITLENIGAVAQQYATFQQQLLAAARAPEADVTSISLAGGLSQALQGILYQQRSLALPLFVVVAQVVGLAVLFVLAMASLLVEGQRQDLATLKSRGASGAQVLGLFAAQGGALALLAALAGPFLARALSQTMVARLIPGLADGALASLGGLARAWAVVPLAGVGALLCVSAVLLAAAQTARLDVLAVRREEARPTRVALWRRLHLDLLAVVLCVAGYLELSQYGSLATRDLLGTGADPVQLLAPSLLLLAGALLVLRVVPFVARAGAWLAAWGRGLTMPLAFTQIERSPACYSRGILLVVLAVGLGLFGLTYNTTLGRSLHDRATYDTGADLRLSLASGLSASATQGLQLRMAGLPGVGASTPLYRAQATTTATLGGQITDVLGIDPATFGQVAGATSWRADYASSSLDTLLGQMRAHQRGEMAGIAAPIWALVSQDFAARNLLKVGDAFALNTGPNGVVLANFTVGGIVRAFPTLFPTAAPGSFIVVPVDDYLWPINHLVQEQQDQQGKQAELGPNELWLRETGGSQRHAALLHALADPTFDVVAVAGLRETLTATESDPVSAGMRGLLFAGVVMAALLAILGSAIQALLTARERARQFAALRTLGMSRAQVAAMLLGEQVVVYAFGVVGGSLLGALLARATLSYLDFSGRSLDPAHAGVPPYVIGIEPRAVLLFYVALLGALALTLVLAAWQAGRLGLGETLRVGED